MVAEAAELTPWSARLPRPRLRSLCSIGAGALVASFFIGTGDIAIATEMGAIFGFDMWWSYFALGLAGWSLMDMSIRYWLRFGKTPVGLFKEVHPLFGAYLFLTIIVTTTLGAYSQWNACAEVLSSFVPGVPRELLGFLAALGAFALLALGVYRRIEMLFVVGLIVLVVLFALAAWRTGARVGEALGGLVPSIPEDAAQRSQWFSLLQKNAGSLINAWLILVYPYTMLEKGWCSSVAVEGARILRRARFDCAFGIAAAGLVALPLLAVAKEVALPFGIVPTQRMDFAALLEPLFGAAAKDVFLIGLLLAAWTAGIGWLTCGAWAVLDFGNLHLRLGSKPFCQVLAVFVVTSACILVLRVQPMYGIRIFTIFLSVVFPVVALVLVWRISRPDMGYYRWYLGNVRGVLVVLTDVFAVLVSLVVGWGMLLRLF